MNSMLNVKSQKGVLLLEAMIAILLFSVGVLAVVGLQANAIKNVSQSKFRSDAAFMANQILGQMWADRTNVANYALPSGSSANVTAWKTQVGATLPNATGANAPTITITPTAYAGPPAYTSYQITVTVRWQTADEMSAASRPPAHQHVTTATITCC
jgi:type IV pilus assembly protein PilV